ncbi:SPOR domain-containing protein [Desulfatitalea tepidiphila]|uniref:SPOR domain-containing protein n=1 Tax=Desulfatitalea tepidiphila TaxID=1185843 RepID=UPI0006B4B3F6|nr:SPOR domain-containing protein [Desulfatitalea tepidiphila]
MTDQQPKFAIQITRKASLVWAGVLLFVMGWMFVLGILVGRGTAPVPLKAHALEQELRNLKAAMLRQQQEEIETRVNPGDAPATELGFYEALKKPPAPTARRIADAPQAVKKPAPVLAEKKPAAPTPIPERKPEKAALPPTVPPVAAKPVAAPKTVAPAATAPAQKERFAIQVGAFKDAASADGMVDRLRGKGYPAYHLRTELPGKGVWYRVRVGAFAAREGAETMLTRLKGDQVQGMVVTTP